MDRAEVEGLVRAAAAGDQLAFDELVARFSGLVWSVIRAHRLPEADAQDVFQTTWLRFVEHLGRLREPRAIGGWLATTARHESLRLLRHADRVRPTTDDRLDGPDGDARDLDAGVLRGEEEARLWRAFLGLDQRCQTLLRVLMADPPPSYEEVSAALDLPVGSIGPTRGRCLARLRELLRSDVSPVAPGAPGR